MNCGSRLLGSDLTRVKASLLALIVSGHAGIYFWHWYLPQKMSAVATAPLSVTVTVVQPKPAVNAGRSPKAAGQASSRRSEVSIPAQPDNSNAIGLDAPDTAPASVAPLQLNLPRESRTAAAIDSPARMALEDPRSNTAKPTSSERFAITLGSYACVVTERMPDGSIYRGPGVWDAAPNSDVTATGGILDPRGPSRVCRRKAL